MGKYRAKFSVPNHLFGTVKVYDDNDPIVLARVKAGMLVRVDGPAPVTPSAAPVVEDAPVAATDTEVPADEPVEALAVDEEKPVKKSAAQRRTKKQPPAKPNPEPEVEGEPEVETEGQTTTIEAPSSVMTSWKVAD